MRIAASIATSSASGVECAWQDWLAEACPNGKSRGAWKFAVSDFRDTGYDWLAVATIKDVALNLVVVVFASDGTTQLMVAAIVIALHGLRCSRNLPYEHMDS